MRQYLFIGETQDTKAINRLIYKCEYEAVVTEEDKREIIFVRSTPKIIETGQSINLMVV